MFQRQKKKIKCGQKCQHTRKKIIAQRIKTISLYKGVISDERRDAELERIFNKLIKLSDEKNPYYSDPDVYGGPATNWYFSHESSIKTYNDLFEKMCSSDGVSDEEKNK